MPDDNPAITTIELWIRSFAPTVARPSHERAIERVKRLEVLVREESEGSTLEFDDRSTDRSPDDPARRHRSGRPY
ncbi:HTH domain-containing protein [Natribaculum luteum]|uniref:HTH domain-containing protein n=1 Tax=Natribaculum luteum TaxID=1586232 RepID=A0ABD5P1Q7_9EURY|nr:HTH domain-containing protein [Natribaculum luteum]